jgi:hypothetical protein
LFYRGSGTFTDVNVTNNLASAAGDAEGGGAFLPGSVNWTGGLVSGNTATTTSGGRVEGGGIGIEDGATLTGLTVTDNTASDTGTGDAEGGGIFTEGGHQVALDSSTVSNNHATSSGGAQGGGIFNNSLLALDRSTVSNNHATANFNDAEGGGIFNHDRLTVTADTLANNSASSATQNAQGGGIWNSDNLAVTNATLFGNSVSAAGSAQGGGIFTGSFTTLINDTLASNTATGGTPLGGGIFNVLNQTVNLVNTIVFDPNGASADPDVSGPISATQNSLYGSNVAGQIAANGDLGGNKFNTNPMLGPLADNGGPTQTLALLPGSPAIGAGTSTSLLGDIPTTDQRGLPRPPGAPDIGAFQVQPPPAPTPDAERAFVVSLVTKRVGKKNVLLVVERFADNGAVKAVFRAPFQPGKFKAIKVTPVDTDGDGVADLLVVTAVRKGKTHTVVLPA